MCWPAVAVYPSACRSDPSQPGRTGMSHLVAIHSSIHRMLPWHGAKRPLARHDRPAPREAPHPYPCRTKRCGSGPTGLVRSVASANPSTSMSVPGRTLIPCHREFGSRRFPAGTVSSAAPPFTSSSRHSPSWKATYPSGRPVRRAQVTVWAKSRDKAVPGSPVDCADRTNPAHPVFANFPTAPCASRSVSRYTA